MLDILLKPTQQTFVDDPESLDETSADELVFDFKHDIKDINKLHAYHAVRVLSTTVNEIIRLQSRPDLLLEFRRMQLAKYNIGVDEYTPPSPCASNPTLYQPEPKIASCKPTRPTTTVERIFPEDVSHRNGEEKRKISEVMRSQTPPLSPPLKFSKLRDNFNDPPPPQLSSGAVTPTEEDPFYDRIINYGHDDSGLQSTSTTSLDGDDDDDDDDEHDECGPYIPIEELTTTADLDPHNVLDRTDEWLRKELNYNMTSKITQQNGHLLKLFDLIKKPPLSIEDFLNRIKTYSPSVSVSCYIHSAFLLFKMTILLDVIPLTDYNAYRFILGVIRCSTKKLEDVYQKQSAFATVGGVSQKDLFKIEVGFLYLSNFKLVVTEENLNFYLKEHFTDLVDFCNQKLSD
ncbi:uncharacterized protein KQ657_004189 [Scheffersomyces spartinae]|uniref:Cyclin n=1 Tax=Scheffersomyces spartinae TaxID=45513 RepID=A0A9P8AJ40_9ASCO|nr:uncharacterized protein KQ657_004189 [Scheffersomyces spartinae]KAG7195073.1 hypothetical protein KQ657_004189 [Scheffersomyces spartinae]